MLRQRSAPRGARGFTVASLYRALEQLMADPELRDKPVRVNVRAFRQRAPIGALVWQVGADPADTEDGVA